MIRGLYTPAWSMMANMKKLDVVTNNIANAGTNGYKEDSMIFESFSDVLARRINDTGRGSNPMGKLGSMELGSDAGEIFTNYAQGSIVKTDKKLDLAIQNDTSAFFTVSVPDGEGLKEMYTRDGSFTMDSNGRLVTAEGYAVMGQNGSINLKSENVSIEADGTIIADGNAVDKLLIKDFADTRALKKYGQGLVEAPEGTEEKPFQGEVKQGFLEQSNVNVVKEMLDMINTMRTYETSQKMLLAVDSTLDKLVNQVGSTR